VQEFLAMLPAYRRHGLRAEITGAL